MEDVRMQDMLATLGLTPEQAARFRLPFEREEHARGASLARQGAALGDLFYLERGLVRLFYTRVDGREFNKSFVAEGELVGSVTAYKTDGVAPFGIEALEPLIAWRAPFAALTSLYEVDPAFERLARLWAEALVVKKERRERALLEEDAQTRYEHFVRAYPGLAARLPLYHIARYIGVTEVSLSRIRARRAKLIPG